MNLHKELTFKVFFRCDRHPAHRKALFEVAKGHLYEILQPVYTQRFDKILDAIGHKRKVTIVALSITYSILIE